MQHEARRQIRFWFDYMSAFAYLGFERLRKLCAERQIELWCTPVYLPGLLQANGLLGSAEIESKRVYMFKHALRLAAEHGIELEVPSSHPFASLLALRVTTLASPDVRTELVAKLFRAAWVLGRDLANPSVVAECLSALGQPAQQLIDAASGEAAKASLRSHTEAALARGVFGVPSFASSQELFWGNDSLSHLVAHLDGERPLDTAKLERWQRLPNG